MKSMVLRVVVLAAVVMGSASAQAWSTKEHMLLTRVAARLLLEDPTTPAGMKAWLREGLDAEATAAAERAFYVNKRVGMYPRGADGLAFWAVVPDMVAMTDRPDRKTEPFGVHERLLHYIDLEFFIPEESQRAYRADLSGKPRLEDVPRDMKDPRYERAGMLPFRVEQTYGELVKALRAGRPGDRAGQYPRDEHAVKWAGYLAHYVQDNTQPHHATIDYKSQSYFPRDRGAPNVHSQMEYIMPDDEHEDHMGVREAFWGVFEVALGEVKDPVEERDVWVGTVKTAMHSYDALPLIGEAAVAAHEKEGGTFDTRRFYEFRGKVRGEELSVLEMKARQMALAAHRTAKLWRQAWEEAHAGE